MFRQAKTDWFALTPSQQGRAAASRGAAVQLGLPQRLKRALGLSLIRRGPALSLPPKPLWFEKGWRPVAGTNQYTGLYQAAGRTCRGLIQQPYPGGYIAYIWHPPLAEIQRNTGHRPCFLPNGEAGRFQVHFHTLPASLDHAITSIEAVLTAAYSGRTA
jgi:hypothetical protein